MEVKRAMSEGDYDTLSAMGREGGRRAALNNAVRKILRIEALERLAFEQGKLYTLSSEGDVLPPE